MSGNITGEVTITRYNVTEDGDREVLNVFREDFESHPDDVEYPHITVAQYIDQYGASFKAWSDPVQTFDNGTRARAFSVDIYVHPGEGWHEETVIDVSGTAEQIAAVVAASEDVRQAIIDATGAGR